MKTRSNTTQGQIDKARDDRIAALEAALRPFAELVEHFPERDPGARHIKMHVNAADVRTAARLLDNRKEA